MKLFEMSDIMPANAEQCADLIIKDCAYFIHTSGFNPRNINKTGLFRGMTKVHNMAKIACPKNRRPVDTSLTIHEILDNYFEEIFDHPYRSSSVFCSGSRNVAAAYGTPHLIFPIGTFKYVWSKKVEDAYNFFQNLKFENILIQSKSTELVEKYHDTHDDRILYEIIRIYLRDNPDLYSSTGLVTAIQVYKINEIMISCKDYYAIPTSNTVIINALVNKLSPNEDEEWT